MGDKQKRGLRRGFTTGTAAAAAAKAAATVLLAGRRPKKVTVTLPSGRPLSVKVAKLKLSGKRAFATVIKDAGDDPDVTNGAEIVSEVELGGEGQRTTVRITGGEGVGTVTKPGLAAAVGSPAINPVPVEMIKRALREAAAAAGKRPRLKVTVSVPRGRELAKKTLNHRLGIVGGISILGTTGIVEPFSHDAYRESIRCALDIAAGEGLSEVVLSTGRSSEKAAEKILRLPPSAFILTGDHVGFAIIEVILREKIKRVTIAGQFGKLTKLAAGQTDTHYTKSRVDLELLARIAKDAGAERQTIKKILSANTAREAFFLLTSKGPKDFFKDFLRLVKQNVRGFAGDKIDVRCVLIGYGKEIVERV